MRVKVGEEFKVALPVRVLPTFTAEPHDVANSIDIETVSVTGIKAHALNATNDTERRFDRRLVTTEHPLSTLGLPEFCVHYGVAQTSLSPDPQFFVQFISREWEKDEVSYIFFRDLGVYVNTGAVTLNDDSLFILKEATVDYITECLYGTSNPEGWSDYYYGFTETINPMDHTKRTLKDNIIKLNDSFKWTREKIAEWISSVENAPKIERFTASWILSTEQVKPT